MEGFIFRNRFEGAHHQGSINKAISRITNNHNGEEVLMAAKAKRKLVVKAHLVKLLEATS